MERSSDNESILEQTPTGSAKRRH